MKYQSNISNTKNFYITLCAFVITLCPLWLNAQTKNELSISLFGGLSGLNSAVSEGVSKNGYGGGLGADYYYGFSPNFGMRAGIEVAMFNSEYSADELYIKYLTQDIYDDSFEFRSTVKKYYETQNVFFLQIPLMLQYQTNGYNRFYLAFGGKAGFPIIVNHKNDALNIKNSGYYPYEDYEYTIEQFMGFGEFNIPEGKNKFNLNPAFFLSVETGGKFNISDVIRLYIGAYLDYGINNIVKNNEELYLIEYNPQDPRYFTINSIFNSQTEKIVMEKVIPVSLGIKIRLALGM